MVKNYFFMARKVTFGQKRKKATYLFLHVLNCVAKKSGNACVLPSGIVFKDLLVVVFLMQNTAAYSKMQIWVEKSYWAKTQQIHEKHTAAY